MKAFSNFLKQKKMLVQILMCGCKVEKFHREQNEHVKKWCNFQYHCDDSHLLFMYSSKANLFVASRIQEMDFHCACAKIRSNLFVIFVYKLDIFELQGMQNLWEKNTLCFQELLVPIGKYLEEIIICKALFTILPQAKKLIFLCTTLVKNTKYKKSRLIICLVCRKKKKNQWPVKIIITSQITYPPTSHGTRDCLMTRYDQRRCEEFLKDLV